MNARKLLEHIRKTYMLGGTDDDAIDAYLAQPEPEPVARIESFVNGSYGRKYNVFWLKEVGQGQLLYTEQPNKTTCADDKKPEPEPVAWASENVIPLQGLKDNYPAILTPFKCAANTVALYTTPPDQSAKIAELEKTCLKHARTKNDLLGRIAELERVCEANNSIIAGCAESVRECQSIAEDRFAQIQSLEAKLAAIREPLREDEIYRAFGMGSMTDRFLRLCEIVQRAILARLGE